MTEESKVQSWWQTLPGILTALATVITAIAGLITILYQTGFFKIDEQKPMTASKTTIENITADKPKFPVAPRSISQPSPASSSRINLLSSENGGQLIVASGDDWLNTIDGKEDFNQISYGLESQSEAVYAFKNEHAATVEMFAIFISRTGDNNVKEFELFAGNDSPTGPFKSLGKFQTQNIKLFKTPYQEFKVQATVAKYFKIKLLSTYSSSHPNVQEVQLFGYMEKE
jgi:hypothetical protein